jgi:hypothetical protein
MQTFLPYTDLAQSAACLDMKRLGKQRVENLQILKSLVIGGGLHGGWSKHPASRMWRGHELALLKYQEAICHEWVDVRGYKDTCWEKSKAFFSEEELEQYARGDYSFPDWFGNEEFHMTHMSNLIRKFPEYYKLQFPSTVPENLEYIWPYALKDVPAQEAQTTIR